MGTPCSNPPAGPGRGCDDKEGTGGASISAAESNSLPNPTLAFTTAGGVTVPDLSTDPSIPVRSAAKADTILPGEKRWYIVYCRDNSLMLPGCPLPLSRFNGTSTAEVTWLP